MRRIMENADYDVGKKGGTDKFNISAHDFVSRPDMKVRNVGQYGDNAMSDVSKIDYDDTDSNSKRVYEDSETMLDRLKEILTRANVSDTHMEKGVKLTQRGCHKVAASLGIAASEVPTLLKSLATKISRAKRTTVTAITEARYTYERDALANVIVRDAKTGNETFLRGTEAADVLRRIENGEDDQAVLAGEMSLMEEDAHPDASYMEEINQKWGTFNFPWSLDDGRHGTGTVRYDADGTITLKHVRDERGRQLNPSAADRAEIILRARDFIGRE